MDARLAPPVCRRPAERAGGLVYILLVVALGFAFVGASPAQAQRLEIVDWRIPIEEERQAEDVLILRDGGVQRGDLIGCVGDTCTLGVTSVPRERIAWIGLEADDDSPPGRQDPSADAVHLRDDSVHPGRLVGIRQYEVVTESGGHPRDEVAWVYLAPEERQTAGGPSQFGAPPDDPVAPEAAPAIPEPEYLQPPPAQPTGGGTGQPPAAGRQAEDVGQCGFWVGEAIFLSRESGGASRVQAAWQLRLREANHQERPGFTEIDLWAEGSAAEQSVVLDLGQGNLCSGSGRTTRFDQNRSVLFLNTSAEPVQIGMLSVPPGGGSYILQFIPVDRLDLACGPTTVSGGFHPLTLPFGGATLPLEPGNRLRGSDSRTFPTDKGMGHWTATWDLSRIEAPCQSPAVPVAGGSGAPASDDQCPKPTNQQALLETALEQQRMLLDRLTKQMDAFQALSNQAQQWKGDFEHASRDCGLWKTAQALIGFLGANYAPTYAGAGGATIAPGTSLKDFLFWVDKVVVGDASWILPNVEYKGWFSAEDAWDTAKAAYDNLGPASPDKMLAELQKCGAPTTAGIYEGAVKYLRLMQQIEPMMQDMHRTLNDLRQKDLELLDKWQKYQRACQEHAECEGQDGAMCTEPQP